MSGQLQEQNDEDITLYSLAQRTGTGTPGHVSFVKPKVARGLGFRVSGLGFRV